MGREPGRREDGKMPMACAACRRADCFPRVDGEQAPAALAFRGSRRMRPSERVGSPLGVLFHEENHHIVRDQHYRRQDPNKEKRIAKRSSRLVRNLRRCEGHGADCMGTSRPSQCAQDARQRVGRCFRLPYRTIYWLTCQSAVATNDFPDFASVPAFQVGRTSRHILVPRRSGTRPHSNTL